MTRVLVVGETWISHATHVKGFDSFTSGTFHSGLGPLRAALEANGISVDHMPAHEAAEGFPLELDGLARWDVIVLSDVGADTLLLHPDVAGPWPYLLGYNRVRLKPEAVLLARVGDDPLLAVTRHGAGRTLAWTSDIGPHWCPEEFCNWPGYARVWTQAVRWLAGD